MTDTEKAIEAYRKKKHREKSYEYYIEHRTSQREFDTHEQKPKEKQPYMSDREINMMYRQAARPQKQIKILAELNDVSIDVIEEILHLRRKKAKRNVCVR